MRVQGMETSAASTRTWRPWVRPLVGATILGALVARLGAGPIGDGLRAVTLGGIALAAGLTALTTACAAWRWQVVARRFGLMLPLGTAVAAYYQSQFLNLTLPGGVVGDLDRGVRHGRTVGTLRGGLGAVAIERLVGQGVLITTTVVTAAVVGDVPGFAAVGVVVLAGGGLWLARRHGARFLTVVVLASLIAVAGHVAIFVVAARVVGVALPLSALLPLALLVLVVAGLPLNVAGWGPREGAAAWAFAASGATAAQGLAVAVAFGAVVTVATLPGGVVLLRRAMRLRAGTARAPQVAPRSEVSTHG